MTPAPKIIFVTKYHALRVTGGAEVQCWLLARELAARGWEVHYASEMNLVPNPSLVEGVMLHGLPEDPRMPRGNKRPLRELMQELVPDVVFTRVYDYMMRDALMTAPESAVRIWSLASEADGNEWEAVKSHIHNSSLLHFAVRLPQYIRKRCGRRKARRFATLILEQHEGQSNVIPDLKGKVAVMHNSHPMVPESEIQKHEGRPRVFWAASIKKWKRPELFWELAKRCSDLDADFVMAGGLQEQNYKPHLQKAVEECGNLSWLGKLPREDAAQQFRQAHLFVSTSISEGFSNTFIESWMHGVPVVSLGVDPGGYLHDKGLGVRANNFDEMEATVRELIGNAEKRKAIGAKARSVANEDFSLKRNVDVLEGLIAEQGVQVRSRQD